LGGLAYDALVRPETQAWIESSEIDLEAASACLEHDLHAPCISHCQQAVEKMLKALWVESQQEQPPPRTHNIVDLAHELGALEHLDEEFLRMLTNQAVVSRYSGRGTYTRETAVEYYERSRATCEQLRQTLS